ncbi:MAG: 6-phosphogluconolactonase [Acidobacteria bacterium]|nr:6-phosphogluconolactonase [Acidobacteriota bacterium]
MEVGKHWVDICDDVQEISWLAGQHFVELAKESLATRGLFSVALSGGSTPKRLYSLLAGRHFQHRVPWSRLYLFWGDERFVPPDHQDSNYRMVKEALLSKVPVPVENIHPVSTDRESPEHAATEYEQTIREFFNISLGQFPQFDLVLLGLGTDGHTASLFPGTAVLSERRRLVAALYVDKPQPHRLTLTVPVFNHAANVIFLVSGEGKASILKSVLQGEYQENGLPAQLINPTQGRLRWIIDRGAASDLHL